MEDHPHLRGEYCVKAVLTQAEPGSPPLAWGIPKSTWARTKTERITPTCVGNTQCFLDDDADAKDHPHLRGEYTLVNDDGTLIAGSPPLAWGIHNQLPVQTVN